jgi:hypothetical protein
MGRSASGIWATNDGIGYHWWAVGGPLAKHWWQTTGGNQWWAAGGNHWWALATNEQQMTGSSNNCVN